MAGREKELEKWNRESSVAWCTPSLSESRASGVCGCPPACAWNKRSLEIINKPSCPVYIICPSGCGLKETGPV